MSRRAAPAAPCVVLAVVLAGVTVPAAFAGERVRVEDLAVERAGEVVRVGYRVVGSIPDEIVERLDAGIAVTFRHRVELVLRRAYLITPSRLLHRCEIETTATYDSLTKQYRLERVVRRTGRDGEDLGETREHRSTARVDEVRSWLTEIDGVEVPSDGLDGDDADRGRVRVSSNLGRRYVLFVFPTAISASAEADLES